MRSLQKACLFLCLALSLVTVMSAQTQQPQQSEAQVQQPAPSPDCGPNDACVLYTSKLLGYIRNDDISEIIQNFRASMTAAKHSFPQALVAAMGDNLAPEYGSRFDATGPKQRARFAVPPTDNVADELASHYDVIVPGKEDFYFGAERLRLLVR